MYLLFSRALRKFLPNGAILVENKSGQFQGIARVQHTSARELRLPAKGKLTQLVNRVQSSLSSSTVSMGRSFTRRELGWVLYPHTTTYTLLQHVKTNKTKITSHIRATDTFLFSIPAMVCSASLCRFKVELYFYY